MEAFCHVTLIRPLRDAVGPKFSHGFLSSKQLSSGETPNGGPGCLSRAANRWAAKEKATSAAVGRRGEGKEGTPSEMLPTSNASRMP